MSKSGPDGRPLQTIFFATNRTLADTATGPVFGYGHADGVTYGRLVVSLPRDEDRAFGAVNAGFRVSGVELIAGDDAFVSALDKATTEPRAQRLPALVFVHGYNESFERAAFRLAEVMHDGCFDVVPVLFAWPSRGSFLDYLYDVESATFSRKRLASLLRLVRDRSGAGVTHIMAHSMGNWIALEALGELDREFDSARSGRRFGAAVFASPDVDIDVFRQEIAALGESARLLILLAAANDPLLGLSAFLAHEVRAGNASPAELAAHQIQPHGNFRIVAMDPKQIGACADGDHRCAETNAVVLGEIRVLLGEAGQLPLPAD